MSLIIIAVIILCFFGVVHTREIARLKKRYAEQNERIEKLRDKLNSLEIHIECDRMSCYEDYVDSYSKGLAGIIACRLQEELREAENAENTPDS